MSSVDHDQASLKRKISTLPEFNRSNPFAQSYKQSMGTRRKQEATFPLFILPFEIRIIVYKHIFSEASVNFWDMVKAHKLGWPVALVGSYPGHLELGPEYNIILACERCRTEAWPIYVSVAKFTYHNGPQVSQITRLCSPRMAARIRELTINSKLSLRFSDYARMNEVYPRLERLVVKVRDEERRFTEHMLRQCDYETFVEHNVLVRTWPRRGGPVECLNRDVVEFLSHEAHFDTIAVYRVIVKHFGDNSRTFDITMRVILDMKKKSMTCERL